MAIDLTQPIDITSVNKAVHKHKNVMVPLDMMAASDFLKHCTPIPGVVNSITLGRVEHGTISRQYSGVFLGTDNLGKIVPRDLVVKPCVAEMDDEPERYRQTFITEVKGGLDVNKHPFEVWLIQFGINIASEDLFNVLMTAKLNGTEDGQLKDAFDGFGTIIEKEKTATNISLVKKNMFATGDLTAVNIGQKLLEMWRSMPSTFRKKKSQFILSEDLGDMYDDWLNSEVTQLPDTDISEVQFLRGTKKRCEIVRVSNMPDNSKMVILTTKNNMVYGYGNEGDMKKMVPFSSGNPYKFTAAMKYVFGCQFISLDHSEFCVNDQPLQPA